MQNAAAKSESVIERYIDDFKAFAEDNLFVRDHVSKQIMPFMFNRPQTILDKIVEKQRKDLGYVRIILDKARRFGGSTYIEGRGYWRTSLSFNANAFIVAHEEDSTDTLFSMAKLFHERNPIKPATKYSSKKELLFDTKDGTGLKSEYGLACARDTSAGRSQGIHFLHVSELAFFPDNADELLDGLMSCLPPPPAETEVFLESTGNGYGNRFQRDVFSAYAEGKFPYYQEDGITYAWKNPVDDWVLVFIPWFAHDAYTRDFASQAEKDEFERVLTTKILNKELMIWEESEGLKLRKKYNLSLEQLNWRQWTIENVFKGRLEKFKQEFPATVQESFLSRGSNVYTAELCDNLEANCTDPVIIGDLVERMGKAKIKRNQYGSLSIWEMPKETESYFMTCDAGGGLKQSQKREKREPDPTCMDMWNHRTGRQVAQWQGDIDYDLIADVADLFGRLYCIGEDAELPVACVELQNHGFTVVADLKRKKYPMYEAKPDEPGWLTTAKSKPQMVDGLYSDTRDGSLQIMSRETVSEMRTYIEESGRFNAESGCHDDRVMSAAMASQMMRLLPRRTRGEGKKERQGFQFTTRRSNPRYNGEYQEVRV